MTTTPDTVPQDALLTIGHSTRPIEEFIDLLKTFNVQTLVDIRTVPRSRYNPQFSQDPLSGSLPAAGIAYTYMKDLGGLRRPDPDSPNTGWRSGGFRGYADHMRSDSFLQALNCLVALKDANRTAIMCAEAVPWRCHRSLVADALTVRGISVYHIMSTTSAPPHRMTKFARVEGLSITYPPDPDQGVLL